MAECLILERVNIKQWYICKIVYIKKEREKIVIVMFVRIEIALIALSLCANDNLLSEVHESTARDKYLNAQSCSELTFRTTTS